MDTCVRIGIESLCFDIGDNSRLSEMNTRNKSCINSPPPPPPAVYTSNVVSIALVALRRQYCACLSFAAGCISWHGRCCCRDASSFRTFLLHAFSQVSKTQCPVWRCEHCDLDTQDGQRSLTESDDESNGIRTKEFRDRSAELNSLHQRLHGAARPSSAFVTWPSPALSQALKRDLGRPKTTSTAASSASGYNTPGRSKQALRTHSRSVTSYGKVTPRLTVAAKHRSIGGLSPSISDSSTGDKIPPITRRRGKRTLSQERGTVPRVKTKISVDDFTLA